MSNKLTGSEQLSRMLVKGDDGKKYWHCNKCNKEIEHKCRCPYCGKSRAQKR